MTQYLEVTGKMCETKPLEQAKRENSCIKVDAGEPRGAHPNTERAEVHIVVICYITSAKYFASIGVHWVGDKSGNRQQRRN